MIEVRVKAENSPASDVRVGEHGELRTIRRGVRALILDLKQRGLLESTIVMWAGEMGRTPHHASCFRREVGSCIEGIRFGLLGEQSLSPYNPPKAIPSPLGSPASSNNPYRQCAGSELASLSPDALGRRTADTVLM